MISQLTIHAKIQVLKNAAEVYSAIADPQKMKNYFIASSTGMLEEGKRVIWRFPEYDMDVPVDILEVKQNESIKFSWQVGKQNPVVTIILEKSGTDKTIVRVTEGPMVNDEEGIKWLQGNTEGWANFLACLKAYLEYGINLRKGAFDFVAEKKNSGTG